MITPVVPTKAAKVRSVVMLAAPKPTVRTTASKVVGPVAKKAAAKVVHKATTEPNGTDPASRKAPAGQLRSNTNKNMATKKDESTGLMKLLEDQLADLYYVEKQLVKALPKMAKTATNETCAPRSKSTSLRREHK